MSALGAVSTGALLDELKERGYNTDGPDGRALADACRQLRATLPLEMVNGYRPEDMLRHLERR